MGSILAMEDKHGIHQWKVMCVDKEFFCLCMWHSSIFTILPPSSTCKLLKIPYGVNVRPSNAFNVVDDCDKGDEPKLF